MLQFCVNDGGEVMDYYYFYEELKKTELAPWLEKLPSQIQSGFDAGRWGDLPKWLDAIKHMPEISPSQVRLNDPVIQIGVRDDCSETDREMLEGQLRQLHPWRKGPFDLFGVHIDTEWRSDFKWDRLSKHITPLEGRKVLDVGCGSGYHCLRMFAQGAGLAVGIDPTVLYVVQFHALQKYINQPRVNVLPLGIDDMPEDLPYFDTVFSMGLLYHRRSPLDHLLQLHNFLRDGGEVVLETLIIEGEKGEVLNPDGRYAKMPNVWFIPSVPTLEGWMNRMGFKNVRCVDVSKTSPKEQRATDWMGFHSLTDFLDPQNPGKTVEGYPAPQRAILIAQK